jgi:simple sugar transport system permease protein
MTWLDLAFWELVLAGGIRLGTPVAIAALGETVVERSGRLNLGIEGTMIAGALAGTFGSATWGWQAGVLLGVAVGALFGALMAVLVEVGRANQVVAGIAVTLLGAGLASYLFVVWIPSGRDTAVVELAPRLTVPGLADLPLVGPVLFDQSILTAVALGLAVGTWWLLRRTRAGLLVRAAGDDPAAAAVRGVRVGAVRSLAYVWGGALAGLAGASITVGYLGSYTDGVVAGAGFIALAIVIVGRWSPLGAALAAVGFAVVESLSLQRGESLLPTEFWTALPYLVTLVVLTVLSGRADAPRALGRDDP